MSKKFVNLYREPSNITEVMAGSWQDIRVENVDAGAELSLASEVVEHSGFVIDGDGTLLNGDGKTFPITKNSAFALPSGGQITITANSPMRLLHVEMTLPQ